MKRYGIAGSLALAFLFVLGLSGSAAAADEVPFHGSLEGTFTITPVPGAPPTLVDALVSATGNATQLGRFTLSIPHRVDRSTMPSTATGFYYFTAANGDTVTATFTGLGTPTAIPGVLHIVETATITGGTGRFANATGNFIGERLAAPAIGLTTGFFDGTISAPGFDKP